MSVFRDDYDSNRLKKAYSMANEDSRVRESEFLMYFCKVFVLKYLSQLFQLARSGVSFQDFLDVLIKL